MADGAGKEGEDEEEIFSLSLFSWMQKIEQLRLLFSRVKGDKWIVIGKIRLFLIENNVHMRLHVNISFICIYIWNNFQNILY